MAVRSSLQLDLTVREYATQVGAGVIDVVAVLGKEEVLRRIKAALAWSEAQQQ